MPCNASIIPTDFPRVNLANRAYFDSLYSMRAVLIRVGADGTSDGGEWNAPVHRPSGRFVYIPIIEDTVAFHPGTERRFDEVDKPLFQFLSEHREPLTHWRRRMDAKLGQPMHLDPDYEHLTYGDNGARRGSVFHGFGPGDLIVFYSGLRAVPREDDLVYAMVGVYVIDEIVKSATLVEDSRRHENAHTRKASVHAHDLVVRARPGVSGRCERCIPIGGKRGTDRSNYYLLPELESAWGSFIKKDGERWNSPCLNRSATPPVLGDAPGFWKWWQAQNVALVRRNFDRCPAGPTNPNQGVRLKRNESAGIDMGKKVDLKVSRGASTPDAKEPALAAPALEDWKDPTFDPAPVVRSIRDSPIRAAMIEILRKAGPNGVRWTAFQSLEWTADCDAARVRTALKYASTKNGYRLQYRGPSGTPTHWRLTP